MSNGVRRHVVDLETCVAIVEVSEDRQPFITLLKAGNGGEFTLDCGITGLNRLVEAILTAEEEYNEERRRDAGDERSLG